ncbi:hypothetical protein HMI54_015823 [Coelomomyces lativittatus]|nr:hypothetical protein HMI55_001774 [Coelomomyces lativittatus]KAJ1512273.1 hypothetical protein HMI54_015823 [Coelomomyces lativittatus]KAJ1513704.1 hypothetical protein HMI56_001926 [Coelomomyces lativittatus]
MGKGTDKLYITHSEWSNQFSKGGMTFGGARTGQTKSSSEFRRLPFYCCSLSLQTFKTPICTKEGYIFEYENILHWLSQHKNVHPITGGSLSVSELIHLHFQKTDAGFRCPITLKDFTDASHIVAIAPSGNVYSYDAVKELNIDQKYWFDLIDETISFKKKDIIVIQDPTDLTKRNFEDFWYLKQSNTFTKPEDEGNSNILTTGLSTKVFQEMSTTKFSKILPSGATVEKDPLKTNLEFGKETIQSTGEVGASFTSTSRVPQTKTHVIELNDDKFMYQAFTEDHMKLKKQNRNYSAGQGYVKIKTNLGDLNVELFCVLAPRTCHNFLLLCKNGYYKNVIFHRSISGFMIQGGDPSGTGRGGKSAWGRNFEDEIRPSMTHNERGLLSMANRGKNTNSSQFFFTFAACTHLDGKHTIFGKVVGGMETLEILESIETDSDDRPVSSIIITDTVVYKNPFEEWKTQFHEKQAQTKKEPISRDQQLGLEGTWLGPLVDTKKSNSNDIGKYINKESSPSTSPSKTASSFLTLLQTLKRPSSQSSSKLSETKKKVRNNDFGDFSSW